MNPETRRTAAEQLENLSFALKPGVDFIEIGIGVIESTPDGRFRVLRDADGTLRLPTSPLQFGEELPRAVSRLRGIDGPTEFLTIVETLDSSHTATCLYRAAASDARASGSDVVTAEEILEHGDSIARSAVAALTGGQSDIISAATGWTGGPSRFDELAGRRYIGLGVGAIIINRAGEVLLGLRGPAVRQEAGLWDFPGGGVELGQRAADALHREILEEHGIELSGVTLAGIIDHRVESEGTHWISATFIARTDALSAPVLEPDKCLQARFFKLSELPSLPLTVCAGKSLRMLREHIDKIRA